MSRPLIAPAPAPQLSDQAASAELAGPGSETFPSVRHLASWPAEYKICRTHFAAASFRLDDGRPHRFCQQCSRIQVGALARPKEEFGGGSGVCMYVRGVGCRAVAHRVPAAPRCRPALCRDTLRAGRMLAQATCAHLACTSPCLASPLAVHPAADAQAHHSAVAPSCHCHLPPTWVQPLADFDGSKLSCRTGLARHTQRRKERQARLAAGEPSSGARGPARRAQRAKRAHHEAASPSPSSGCVAAVPGSSGGSGSDEGSQGRHQRRCLSPAPAGEQPAPVPVQSAPLVHQQQARPGPGEKLHAVSAGLQQQREALTVLQFARQAQPLLTLAQPVATASAVQAPAPVQPSVGHNAAPLLAQPQPVAAPQAVPQRSVLAFSPLAVQPAAAPQGALPPLLLPANRPLDPVPSLALAPVTPHQSLTPDDMSPACSEPLPTGQPGSVPRAAELLVRLLALTLQHKLQAQPPQPPHPVPSTAGFSFGAPGGSLSLPLPPPDSPAGASRRSAFRKWQPPAATTAAAAAAGAPGQPAPLFC